MVLDARDSFTGLTLGELFGHYLQHVGKFNYLRKAMVALNDSYCSFYEVTNADAHGAKLWDIAGKQEIRCWNSSGYSGRQGEVWYVRLLPPLVDGSNRSVTMGTPYVFRDSSHRTWEELFKRYMASECGVGYSLRDYLKYGKSPRYWLKFVFQAFVGYTGNMILITGVPEDPASLPHADPKQRI